MGCLKLCLTKLLPVSNYYYLLMKKNNYRIYSHINRPALKSNWKKLVRKYDQNLENLLVVFSPLKPSKIKNS